MYMKKAMGNHQGLPSHLNEKAVNSVGASGPVSTSSMVHKGGVTKGKDMKPSGSADNSNLGKKSPVGLK